MIMKEKVIVLITVPCGSLEEVVRAKETVLFHLETLNPKISIDANTLIVKLVPLDSKLFYPDEACEIIRQTLAQSLTFNHEWTCTLQAIN